MYAPSDSLRRDREPQAHPDGARALGAWTSDRFLKSVHVGSWVAVALVSAILIGCTWDEGNLLTARRPSPVVRFRVLDHAGQALWEITSSAPAILSRIEYGVVPDEFTQIIPEPGVSPRPLSSGEELLLETTTTSRVFRHRGHATGERGFRGGGWEDSPTDPKDGHQNVSVRPTASSDRLRRRA